MEPLKKLKSKIRSRPNNIDALVASNLKKRRVELNITQKELATAVGVTTQQIQKYEKAVDRVSSGNLFYFAQILKVPG